MASKTVDDLIVALMSMGFELSDCHDAIQQGKVTVESAVEWLISGKPGFVKDSALSTPHLKLNPAQKSSAEPSLAGASQNPFAAPIPALPVLSSETVSAGDTLQGSSEESDVVSRLRMNDEQKKYKKEFEEKCRQAAQKQAKEEKINAKKEHERILKDIAEDRDKQKMMRVNASQVASTSATSSTDTSSQKSSPDKCLLQIRLPDGRCLRESFSPDATLNTVWDFVFDKFKGTSQMCFMQPFPRREFTKNDFSSTLKDLGLSPSGSLVLKKPQENQAMETTPIEEETQPTEDGTERMDVESFEQRINQRWGTGQQWGRGHRLDDAAVVVENVEEDMDSGEDDEDVVIHDDDGQFGGMNRGLMAMMGNQFPPMRGIGQGMGWGEDNNRQIFQGVGQMLVPEGHPGDVRQHQNKSAAEMAAEAARGRFAIPAAPEVEDVTVEDTSSHLMYHPPSLLQLCLHHVSCRLNNPRNPYVSLSGISEDLAQKIITQLLKDRVLRPKTLQLFIPCYLTKLLFDCYPYTTNELLNAVKYHVHLKHLSLNSCPLITDGGLKAITGLKKLKVLNLGSCTQLTNKCLVVVSDLPNLQGLNLEDTKVTDSGIIEFLSTCSKTLQNLNLNRTHVTQQIISHLKVLPCLKSLYLEQTKISSLSGIEDLTQLEVLDVAQTGIVTESLLCLQHHPALTCLSIANTENVIGDLALQYIAGLKLHTLYMPSRHTTTNEGLSHLVNMNLTALDLTNFIHIGDEGLVHVGKITSLTTLLLSNTKLTDEGMFYLEGLINLQVLYLDRTMVSDVGVRVLKHFTKLEELSLASTSVTSHFLVSGVLSECQMLSKLNLSRTNISDKGIASLRLKNLTLLNLDYTRVHPHMIQNLNDQCPMIRTVTYAKLAPLTEEDED